MRIIRVIFLASDMVKSRYNTRGSALGGGSLRAIKPTKMAVRVKKVNSPIL